MFPPSSNNSELQYPRHVCVLIFDKDLNEMIGTYINKLSVFLCAEKVEKAIADLGHLLKVCKVNVGAALKLNWRRSLHLFNLKFAIIS